MHRLISAFFARYCVTRKFHDIRSWCWDVNKCSDGVPYFYTCRKVWLHCLKTDHMAHKPSSKYVVGTSSMHASSKGVKQLQLWQLFSVDEGRERIQIPFFSGPSSVLQRNAMSFRWWVDHGSWNSLLSYIGH